LISGKAAKVGCWTLRLSALRVVMHTFKVVKEPHGWAVRLGDGMCTPFWSRTQAIREANRLCEALRLHGVSAEVVVDEEPTRTTKPAGAAFRSGPPVGMRDARR
jgi:hypothetical protein